MVNFLEILFISSFLISSAKFSKLDAGNVILFQIKVFGTNIKKTALARYFIKVTARPSFTRLCVITQIKRIHKRRGWSTYSTNTEIRLIKFQQKKFSNYLYTLPWKYKNTRNNYSNMFIVLGALKSLLCFPLDVDVNDILNRRTNYLLRQCRKKAIANK